MNPITEPPPLELEHLQEASIEDRPRAREGPSSHVVNSRSPDSAAWTILCDFLQILMESIIQLRGGTSEITLRRRLNDFWQNIVNNGEELLHLVFWFIFSCSIFMGLSIGATFVSYLQSDSIALSLSPTCGDWIGRTTKTMVFAWNLGEEQAAGYYRNCYEADPSVQECNIYANNGPLSNTTDNDDCPFRGDVCLLGPKSAVTFDTGYLDINTLGINTRKRLFYRRRTTCAPLVTDGYVDVQDNYSGVMIQAQFYYGPRDQGWTYSQSRMFLPEVSSLTYEVIVRKDG